MTSQFYNVEHMTDSMPPETPDAAVPRLVPPEPPLANAWFCDVSECQAALLAALAAASKQFDRIGKSATGQSGGGQFKYADLAQINQAIRSAEKGLADQGVAVMQPVLPSPLGEGWTRIATIIAGHGATITFPYDLRLAELAKDARANTTAQKLGTVLTYMRRYLLEAALNLRGDADLDSQDVAQTAPRKQATPPVQAQPSAKAAPKPQQRKKPPPRAKPAAVAKPVVAKPVVARPAVAPVAVKAEVVRMPTAPEPPHPADQEDHGEGEIRDEQGADFSMREPGDDEPGEEHTILEMSDGQKDAIKTQVRRLGWRQRSKLDAFIKGVVPGANAENIRDNAEHAQLVIDAMAAVPVEETA